MRRGKWPAIASLIDETGEEASDTLSDVGESFSQSALNENFATLNSKLEEVLSVLRDSGTIKEVEVEPEEE